MGDLFGGLGEVSKSKVDENAEKLMAYEKCHAQLLRDYMNEIKQMDDMLYNVRTEQTKFFLEDLPKINQIMNEDNISSNETRNEWIELLVKNMENSFNMSMKLIQDFCVDKKDEFNQQLKNMLNRV